MPSAVSCTNKGCGKTFNEQENANTACEYHSGAPVFHEGLKGWSCCSKKVTDFEEFLKIPGCTVGPHSHVAQPAAMQNTTQHQVTVEPVIKTAEGVEMYGTAAPAATAETFSMANVTKQVPKIKEEELQDAEESVIEPGTQCKRPSCKAIYTDESSRTQECVFHSGEPVFHEGSKGWSCCSRKVLEFDEFLKIQGCKRGHHRFTQVKGSEEELVEIRHDWYQTQGTVIISVFAKKLDKKQVFVSFEENELKCDLVFMDGRKGRFYSKLCQPIHPSECKYSVLSTKLEIVLKKANGISWPSLEPCDNVTSWTTFGAVGSVGTVGGKSAIVAADAPIHLLKK